MARKKVKQEPKIQGFILKKRFVTKEKTYEIGEFYSHNDKRVINFLKQQEII